MSVRNPCPGCGVERYGNVCCDACWDRAPAKLVIISGQPAVSWRRRLASARVTRNWTLMDRIFGALRAWLTEHPVEAAHSGRSPSVT